MFTFSFSSAFAATPQEQFAENYSTTLGDQYFELLWNQFLDNTNVMADNEGSTTWSIDKSVKAGLKAEAKVVYDYYMLNVATAYVTELDNATNGFLQKVLNYSWGSDANTKQTAFKVKLAAAQFAVDKADALAALSSVPTYNYSTEVMSKADATTAQALTGGDVVFVGKDYTYKVAADKLVEYFKGEVEDLDDFDADATVKTYKDASDDAAGIVSGAVLPLGYATYGAGADAGKVTALALTGAYDLQVAYNGVTATKNAATGYTFPDGNLTFDFYDVNKDVNNWSTAAIDAGNKKDAAAIAAVKAQNAANYANYIIGKDAATVKNADKWLKVADILADAGLTYTSSPAIAAPAHPTYVAKADKIADLEAFAAKYGAEKNADGQLVRDAALVQKYLKEGTTAIAMVSYANLGTKYDQYEALIFNAKSEVIARELAFAKDSFKKAAELIVADFEDEETFYGAELTKIKGYVEKYVAKIEAAETKEAAKAAYEELLDKIKVVDTASELDTTWTTAMVGAVSPATAADTVYKAAKDYVAYYNGTVTEAGSQLDDATLKDRLAEMIGESGFRTAAEIKTLKEEAVKVAQALPTKDAVKAAKKALTTAIDALPAKATVADMAAVQAVSDALDAYQDVTTANDVVLTKYTTAINQIASAYNSQFAQEVAKVSKTDEAAIKAIITDIKAAKKSIKDLTDEPANVLNYMDALKGTLEGYLGDIKTAEKKAVEAAIAAIPINVTEADKATVQKARELYDAYVAKYTDLESAYDATSFNFGANTKNLGATYADGFVKEIDISVLTAAEAVLGLNYDPVENAKAYVQDLKIAARSVKTSKGVKVTINADVQPLLDDGFTVEYKFYRSTKSNKNFGKAMITKTTGTYTNTKGVKGTKYYYKAKLVVKNAAGEVVATTPLTQCLYATRTF